MARKLKLSYSEIILLYLNGNSCRQIALRFEISRTPILKILRDNNIVLRNKSQTLKLLPKPSQISKEKNRLAHLGKHFSIETEFKKGCFSSQKGKEFPERRKKNPITPLTSIIRASSKYSNWRTQVFGRDNFTCQKCGVRGTWLEAHHIKRFSDVMKENNIITFESAMNCNGLWDLNNGITLCKNCHNPTKGRNE